MKKNLFFLAAVPFVALLAGCPNGVEGEGEGDTGEGEGEGDQPFSATLDMTFTNPISNVVVNGSVDPCADLTAHQFSVDEEGSYEVKPTPSDTNRRCVHKTIEVSDPGSYQEHWGTDANGDPVDGDCGLFANGTFCQVDDPSFCISVTTKDTGAKLQIDADFLLPGSIDMFVGDDHYYGEGVAGNGQFIESSGTISVEEISGEEMICQLTYHEVRDGEDFGTTTLRSPICD